MNPLLFAMVDAVISAWLDMVSIHADGCCFHIPAAHERKEYWSNLLGWWRATR